MKTNKLTTKDLINTGIYSAIYIVLIFAVGMLSAMPVFYPILLGLWPLICGIPFMLLVTNSCKFGMVTIMSFLSGMSFFLQGHTWIALVGCVVLGFFADLVLKAGNYKSFKLIIVGYWIFSCGNLVALSPMWIMADTYLAYLRQYMGDEFTNKVLYFMPKWMGLAGIGIVFVGAFCGAFLGRKMLKKHFERAGIM